MDDLHYERCSLCDERYWEHEGLYQMMEEFHTRGGKYLHYLCKICLKEINTKFFKTEEDNNNG
tara:strand:+ start:7425 stop:7613 length:189 start_codon:yes stop_codon:yes gene_type:complete